MNEWKVCGEEQDYNMVIPRAVEVKTDAIIPVDDTTFMNPEDTENALIHYYRSHALQIPQSKAETIRYIFQSLALKHRQTVKQLNRCSPVLICQLNIIGGGLQNKLLSQLTASELDIPVYAGPMEVTVAENILTQIMAEGEIADLRELREIVTHSITSQVYYPKK